MGVGLTNVALITDGRYGGAIHGFIVAHVVPEASVGRIIAFRKDGNIITISAEANEITMDVSDQELAERRKSWKVPKYLVNRGVLGKDQRLVGSAREGVMGDLF